MTRLRQLYMMLPTYDECMAECVKRYLADRRFGGRSYWRLVFGIYRR